MKNEFIAPLRRGFSLHCTGIGIVLPVDFPNVILSIFLLQYYLLFLTSFRTAIDLHSLNRFRNLYTALMDATS